MRLICWLSCLFLFLGLFCWTGCGERTASSPASLRQDAAERPAPTPARDAVVSSGSPAANQAASQAGRPADEKSVAKTARAIHSPAPTSPAPGLAPLSSPEPANLSGPAATPAFDASTPDGQGPGRSGDKFDHLVENKLLAVQDAPLSTFSIDVDTASYSKTRQYLKENGILPPPDAVRLEEFVNYFDYQYAPPTDGRPFAVHLAATACPWNPQRRLVRIGLKGKELARDQRPVSNLVFLIDVSGSMQAPNKLPLVQRGLEMLVSQLGENDRVAIAVYAGAAGLVLPSTPCDRPQAIVEALARLQAGGSTNGGQGIRLAYQTARENFIKGGVNRVILCSDGDFNVGTTSTGELVRLAEENARTGVYLSVLGFGIGNHNDAMLEQISGKANGNYAFIDTPAEARKVLVDQMTGTLTTIAKDVKIQVEFNPARVAAYRLIGYENRVLADRDFNDDKKDAGDIGAGHTVTALYEIVPVASADKPAEAVKKEVDDLKYQKPRDLAPSAADGELLTVKLRYKPADGDTSTLMSETLRDVGSRFGESPADLQFASSVALFGMLLRGSEQCGDANWDSVLEIATAARGADANGYRAEFLELVAIAKKLSPRDASRDQARRAP